MVGLSPSDLRGRRRSQGPCAITQVGVAKVVPPRGQISTTNPWLRLLIPRDGTGLPWRVAGGGGLSSWLRIGCVFRARNVTFCGVLHTPKSLKLLNLLCRAADYESVGRRFESSWAHHQTNKLALPARSGCTPDGTLRISGLRLGSPAHR